MGIKTNKPFFSFSAGQIGPLLLAQSELPTYQRSAERLRNFIPHLQGPARFREGTRFIRETSDIAILHPFVFSDSQSFMLEFTHRRVRVFDADGLIVHPTGTGPITNAIDHPTEVNTTQVTQVAHGFADYAEVIISGVNTPTGGAGAPPNINGQFTIRVEDPDTYRINQKWTVGWTFAASGSSKAKKVASCLTPYRAYDDGEPDTDIPTDPASTLYLEKGTQPPGTLFTSPEFLELQFAQAFDVMYIVHKNAAPRKLTRSSATGWACATYSRTNDPFTGNTLYPAAISFHEQRLFFGGLSSFPQRIHYTKAGAFDVHTTGSNAIDAGSYTASTRRQSSIRSLLGNEKFLYVGGSDGSQKMAGSGPEEAITPTSISMKTFDNYGVAKSIPQTVDKDIVYIQKDLRRIRAIQYNSDSDGYVPVDLTKISDDILRGEANQMAYQEGTPSVLWVQCNDGGLVGLNLDSQEQIVAWHPHNSRTGDRFKSVAVRPIDRGYDEVWVIVEREIGGETKYFIEVMAQPAEYPRQDDFYTGEDNKETDEATYRQAMWDAQKYGYHLDCGLSYDGADNDEDIVLDALTGSNVLFTASSARWAAGDVGRFISQKNGPGRAEIITYNSTTTIHVRIDTAFDVALGFESGTLDMFAGEWFISATTLSGLDHLIGETVQVVADGAVHADLEVDEDGMITLSNPATVVHAGFAYSGMIKTVNIDSGGTSGPAANKNKNVHKAVIMFRNTLGAKFGTDPYDMQQINYRRATDNFDRPPPLFSGPMDCPVSDVTAIKKHVYITQDVPLPCTVLAIEPFLSTENE